MPVEYTIAINAENEKQYSQTESRVMFTDDSYKNAHCVRCP